MEDDRALKMNDKPNAADFADQRELALVKATQRNREQNRTLRLSPPMLSARASEIDTTSDDSKVEVLPPETKDSPDEEDEMDGSIASDDEDDEEEEDSNMMIPVTIGVLVLAIIMAIIMRLKM